MNFDPFLHLIDYKPIYSCIFIEMRNDNPLYRYYRYFPFTFHP